MRQTRFQAQPAAGRGTEKLAGRPQNPSGSCAVIGESAVSSNPENQHRLHMKNSVLALPFAGLLLLTILPPGGTMRAQTLFSDNFDTDTSAQWTVFNGSADGTPDFSAQFAFDYSTNRYVANGVTNF